MATALAGCYLGEAAGCHVAVLGEVTSAGGLVLDLGDTEEEGEQCADLLLRLAKENGVSQLLPARHDVICARTRKRRRAGWLAGGLTVRLALRADAFVRSARWWCWRTAGATRPCCGW